MPMQTVHKTSHAAEEAVDRQDDTTTKATDGSTKAQEDDALCREGNGKSATYKPDDPWNPPRPPPHPSILALQCPHQYNMKYLHQIADFLSEVRATNIIVPDRTPKETTLKFYDIFGHLLNVLKKDSVSGFLRLFKKYRGHLVAGYVITPQTLDLIITENALRCAKLVLEGKAPELRGMRANPNYMTSFGYFPLHITAQIFSADMVKILLRYGALANLRTCERIIEGLLPLHVAIENTCQHTYLEDNLLADESYLKGYAEYIYRLIHLLCLPEMKIFLDTIRLLAAHTDNVVDELWNYIEHGKIVPAAILLLAAQRRFHKLNGFDTIKNRIDDSIFSLIREGCGLQIGKNTKAAKQRKEKEVRFYNALFLVRILLKAGEALDEYIQTHSEASHQEVHGKVSAILQNYDVGPHGKGICVEELKCRSYDCGVPNSVLHGRGACALQNMGTKIRPKQPQDHQLWMSRQKKL
ncbi:uncharacterized protein [Triticum aestivum]|uniref:uncharacterized protein isoform X2 n=1 Tax=Triticum aestivum TaxID=4565 RepID=UPI001D00AA4C|nr:uncharacterized protein LOC123164923 isoform X2 [Triticum aestivum]